MPTQVHDCVEAVLDDHPNMDESRAWAICQAQVNQSADCGPEETALEIWVHGSDRARDSFGDGIEGKSRTDDPPTEWWDDAVATAVALEDSTDTAQKEADGDADAYDLQTLRVVGNGGDFDGEVIAVGVDFPNAGVYVDWLNEKWPDDEQLEGPHVSDYDSIGDLEQATGNTVEIISHLEQDEIEVAAKLRQYTSEATEAAQKVLVVTGASISAAEAKLGHMDVDVDRLPLGGDQ